MCQSGYRVRCLVRPQSDLRHLPPGVELVQGDFARPESLKSPLRGVEVFVNVASLGFGHAESLIRMVESAGVRRAIFFSSTSIYTTLDPESKAIRIEAEKAIQSSSLAHTILRPTMIYGGRRDRNLCRLVTYLSRWRLIPVFGSGEYLQQPVYVDDLAAAVDQCLRHEDTICQSYNLPGRAALTFNQLINIISSLLNRRIYRIHLPYRPLTILLGKLEKSGVQMPISAEQILRLNEHKAFEWKDAHADFGYSPRDFREGMELELQDMGIFPESGILPRRVPRVDS